MHYCNELIPFIREFNSDENCYRILATIKWQHGFKCRRCECTKTIRSRSCFHRRCRDCRYEESCTAHTLFHKLKFPINKAFAIIFQMATMKKGMSSCEISRQYGITQETAWFFMKKIQLAMSLELPCVGQNKRNAQQRHLNRPKSKSSSLILNERNATDISKKYIPKSKNERIKSSIPKFGNTDMGTNKSHQKSQGSIFEPNIFRKEKRGLRLLHAIDLFHVQLESIWPEFKTLNLKSWLIGIHHKVTLEHISGYFSAFFYRLRNRRRISSLPAELIRRFTKEGWRPYTTLVGV